jgi:hypothetical protein
LDKCVPIVQHCEVVVINDSYKKVNVLEGITVINTVITQLIENRTGYRQTSLIIGLENLYLTVLNATRPFSH